MDFGMIANVVPPARYPNVQRPSPLGALTQKSADSSFPEDTEPIQSHRPRVPQPYVWGLPLLTPILSLRLSCWV